MEVAGREHGLFDLRLALGQVLPHERDQRINLIVRRTHGRGRIFHVLLDSVAEQVLRKAPCPVLVVREPEHEFVVR